MLADILATNPDPHRPVAAGYAREGLMSSNQNQIRPDGRLGRIGLQVKIPPPRRSRLRMSILGKTDQNQAETGYAVIARRHDGFSFGNRLYSGAGRPFYAVSALRLAALPVRTYSFVSCVWASDCDQSQAQAQLPHCPFIKTPLSRGSILVFPKESAYPYLKSHCNDWIVSKVQTRQQAATVSQEPSTTTEQPVVAVRVKNAYRVMKSLLVARPIFHRLEHCVETHIFLCLLAYHLLVVIETTLQQQGNYTSRTTV
jgi:hypothetical protein